MTPNVVLDITSFRHLFFQLTSDWTWEVEGFLDTNDFVHPIDGDTKVISTIFERLCSPVIRTIAKRYGYTVETANQTTYPDFTLTLPRVPHRIALDVKTTYVQPRMLFTLGGYNSFLRNNTKNILYPYNTYNEHWMLGFVYEQTPPFPAYDLDNMPRRSAIDCPYRVYTVFVREKHAITGLRAGSGNTKNIGSVTVTNSDDFKTVSGPFTYFRYSKEACDFYWINYEHYVTEIHSLEDLLNHPDFQDFR